MYVRKVRIMMSVKCRTLYARVDPELLRGGGNPWGGQPTILVIFSEKPYQIKEI